MGERKLGRRGREVVGRFLSRRAGEKWKGAGHFINQAAIVEFRQSFELPESITESAAVVGAGTRGEQCCRDDGREVWVMVIRFGSLRSGSF